MVWTFISGDETRPIDWRYARSQFCREIDGDRVEDSLRSDYLSIRELKSRD